MILLPGYAPDKGIHVVSIVALDNGMLQFEPVIVPDDVRMTVLQSGYGIRWELTPWNQVHIITLRQSDLPPAIHTIPLPCPPTPGYSISTLTRPRPSPSQWRLAATLASTTRPATKTPPCQPLSKLPQTAHPVPSKSKIPTQNSQATHPKVVNNPVLSPPQHSPKVSVQRPRLSLDAIYVNAGTGKGSTSPQQNISAKIPSTAEIPDGEEQDNASEDDIGDEEDDGSVKKTRKPKSKKKFTVEKGWQSAFNLSPAHNILEEQDFMHTFACRSINSDGTREIVYQVDGMQRTAVIPRSTYGRSLHDILPHDVPRKFWMHLVRHPLVWDGLRDDIKGNNEFPTQEHEEWTGSLQYVGLHCLPDWSSEEDRPAYSMHLLIRLAILGSPYQVLSTNDLRVVLMAKYPFFRAQISQYWYNQISNVHSRQEYSSWLGAHPLLSGAQIKYWNVTDVPSLSIPEEYKFPAIKLSRVRDSKGHLRLAIESTPSEPRQAQRVVIDRTPVEVPETAPRPVITRAKVKVRARPVGKTKARAPPKPRPPPRMRGLRGTTPESPPPSTVLSSEGDGLSPESEDEFSIADPLDLEYSRMEAEVESENEDANMAEDVEISLQESPFFDKDPFGAKTDNDVDMHM